MLVFSIFLGILLRFLMLTANISLCHAEWQGVEISLLPLNEVILWFARDVHPPLYFSILHGILKTLGPQDLWLRLPSFITGCGTLIAIYWIAENFFGKQTARLSLFLAAISPFLIHLSHEVRNHGPATFFVVLATFFLIRLTQSPLNKIRASLFIGAALLAVYTAHLTWFWFAGILSFHIVYLIQTSQAKKSLWAHAIFLVLASPALVLFIYQITQNHELTGGWVGLENYSGLTPHQNYSSGLLESILWSSISHSNNRSFFIFS